MSQVATFLSPPVIVEKQQSFNQDLSPSEEDYLAMLEDTEIESLLGQVRASVPKPKVENNNTNDMANQKILTFEIAHSFHNTYILTLNGILDRLCPKLMELIRTRFAKGVHHLNPPSIEISTVTHLIPISSSTPSNSAKALTSAIDLYFNVETANHPDLPYCIDNDIMFASINTIAKLSPLLVYSHHRTWLHFQSSFGASSDWLIHSMNQSQLSSLHRSVPIEYYTAMLSLCHPTTLLHHMFNHPSQIASIANLWLLSMFEPSYHHQLQFTLALIALPYHILPFDPKLPHFITSSNENFFKSRLSPLHYFCRGIDYAFRSTCDSSLANEPPLNFAPRLQRIKNDYASYFVRIPIVLQHIKNQMTDSTSITEFDAYITFMYSGLCSIIRHSLFILESDSNTSMLTEFVKTFFLDISIPTLLKQSVSSPTFITYNCALHSIPTLIQSLSSLNFASPTPSRIRLLAHLFARYFVILQSSTEIDLTTEVYRVWVKGQYKSTYEFFFCITLYSVAMLVDHDSSSFMLFCEYLFVPFIDHVSIMKGKLTIYYFFFYVLFIAIRYAWSIFSFTVEWSDFQCINCYFN
jgi:hypothetical protein